MLIMEKIKRFSHKTRPEQISSIRNQFHVIINKLRDIADNLRSQRVITGNMVAPKVLHSRNRFYIAYRPDLDVNHDALPELRALCDSWVWNNVTNNAGDLPRLYALLLNIKQVMLDGISGDFAELGVYRGNSAAVLAHYARKSNRAVFLFDTFEGFESRDLTGIDANKTQFFTDTSLDMVRKNVGDESVVYVKGSFPETVNDDISERHFAVVHLDCDLYAPTKAGLEFFYPRLSPGGLIIIHDYSGVYWDGIKRAVDEYLQQITETLVLIPDKAGTAMIRKSR